MKKAIVLTLTLLLTSCLVISIAAPALACHYDTVLEISATSTQVSPGDSITIVITDTYSGDTPLESPYVELYINDETIPGNLIATLDRSNWYVSGDVGAYDQMDINGEIWRWEYPVVITGDVTFIAIGYATDYQNNLFTSPTERGEVSVTVEENGGGEGFTPGFWKNHHDAWAPTGFSIGDDFDTVFGTDMFDPDISLDDALRLKGGKCNALARHAVAALLNAAHPNVSYEFTVNEVINMVQNATDCEDVKDILEEQNELEGDISE